MRRLYLSCLLFLSFLVAHPQVKEIHILSCNDMHAAIDNMPQLAAIVDSLREINHNLLVFSAGDNRTGNPINDLYAIPSYPMTALMNFIGFDGSAFGNHEFDNGPAGLAKVMATSNFPFLCANVKALPEMNVNPLPYKIFDVQGVKVGVLGVVQLGTNGFPDAHPDLMKGFTFFPVKETIQQYEWLREQVDVLLLLSHNGYEEDVKTASAFPFFDVILGGHSHTQIKGGEMHHGVLITQNVNKLKRVTYITIKMDGNKVVDKWAENIEVEGYGKKNDVVQNMVDYFNNNPEFFRQLAMAETDFTTAEQLGCLMCDAWREETGADLALTNRGGVRYEEKKAGPFTVNDVLRLDPFGNDCIEMYITGKEFKELLLSCCHNDESMFPFVSGVNCEITRDIADSTSIKSLQLFTPDGRKINMKKKYKVVTNSYVAAICDAPRSDQGRSVGIACSDLLMRFLEKKETVNYQGISRIKIVR